MAVDPKELEAIADKLDNILECEHPDLRSRMNNTKVICAEAATLIRAAMAESSSGKKK